MPDARPNILLITSDQQHWTSMGFRNPELHTPNLDRLAREGVSFERAYTTNPTCTPARASILTGQYPSQHGAWALGTKLPETALTVGAELVRAGYGAALVGKAHFQPLVSTREYPSLEAHPILHDRDFWRSFHGPWYGFEHIEIARNHTDESHVGQHYALWLEEKGLEDWRRYFQPLDGPRHSWPGGRWELPEEFHPSAWIAERANALIDRYARSAKPFFLWASFFDPHFPHIVPAPWDTMYDPAVLRVPQAAPGEHERNPPHFRLTQEEHPDFAWHRDDPEGFGRRGLRSHRHSREWMAKDLAIHYGMISLMDKYIGAILDRLDELDLARDTLIVFTSDHGDFFGQHGMIHKGTFLYEDMIRVPFVVRSPGCGIAGAESPAIQSLADLAPSFLGAAGAPIPRSMTGVDQSAVWRGERAAARQYAFIEDRHQPNRLCAKCRVDERYKITVYRNQNYGEMFDLAEDPGEIRNRWDDPAAAALKSELLLKLLHAQMDIEPMWMPRLSGA